MSEGVGVLEIRGEKARASLEFDDAGLKRAIFIGEKNAVLEMLRDLIEKGEEIHG